MTISISFDPESIEADVLALMAADPTAPVGAIDSEGQFTSLPDSFVIGDHPVVTGRSPLDMMRPSDRVAILRAWEQGKTVGACSTDVLHLAADDQGVRLHFADLRTTHGVVIMLVEVADTTEQGDAERELMRDIPMAPPRLGIMKKTELGLVLESDNALCRMLGWSAEELLVKPSYELVHPDHQVRAIDSWLAMLSAPGASTRWRGQFSRKDGTWIWVEVTNYNLLHDPEHGYVLGEMVDITDEMEAQEALRSREQLMQRLAQAVPLGLFQFDSERQVVYTNQRLHGIVGTDAVATVAEQLAAVIEDDKAVVDAAIDAVLGEGSDQDLEVRLQRFGSDDLRLCAMSLRALTSEAGEVTGAIACISDVTESARLRDELRMRATFDALTGSLNRASVMTALQTQLSESSAPGAHVGVIFIDLDHFKPVNDMLGHATGDALLKIVAERLQRAVRGADFVGRLGGDEFMVVCPLVSGPDETLKVARRMAKQLNAQVEVAGNTVQLQASIGVACAVDDNVTAEALVADADTAMYESKRQSTGTPVLFDPSLRTISE